LFIPRYKSGNVDYTLPSDLVFQILGGKSAIQTAIVVGLGGKANVTGRGNSIKGFIKTGKQ